MRIDRLTGRPARPAAVPAARGLARLQDDEERREPAEDDDAGGPAPRREPPPDGRGGRLDVRA